MKILVALKQVPDTETKIKIQPEGTALDLSDVKWVTSPYDEYALEEAMRLKESQGATVSALAVGDDRVKDVLRNALALGADEALHVSTSEKCEDPFVVATYVANAVRDRGFDLLLFGNKGSGGDHAAVGPMVAELLGIAQANVVIKLTLDQGRFFAERQVESGLEVFFVFKIILININTTPLTIIRFINGNNTQSRIDTVKMIFPKVICDGLSNNECFSFLLSIFSALTFLILSICCLKSSKYFFKFFFHNSPYLWGPYYRAPFLN